MKKWNCRLKKIETKVYKINKDEILQDWIENQKLPSDSQYKSIYAQVPEYLKGECMKKILIELRKNDKLIHVD